MDPVNVPAKFAALREREGHRGSGWYPCSADICTIRSKTAFVLTGFRTDGPTPEAVC